MCQSLSHMAGKDTVIWHSQWSWDIRSDYASVILQDSVRKGYTAILKGYTIHVDGLGLQVTTPFQEAYVFLGAEAEETLVVWIRRRTSSITGPKLHHGG